jgi:hypothetical protein
VVEEFGKCGQISNYINGPKGANYIHIEFQVQVTKLRLLSTNFG